MSMGRIAGESEGKDIQIARIALAMRLRRNEARVLASTAEWFHDSLADVLNEESPENSEGGRSTIKRKH